MHKQLSFLSALLMSIYVLSAPESNPNRAVDTENMHENIYAFAEQMEQAMTIGQDISLKHTYDQIDAIVFAGMGGSGMSGTMAKTIIEKECTMPLYVHQNYDLPHWINKRTLVICISYSGNTEETLSCFQAAHEKQAPIIGVTSGGTLLEECKTHEYDYVRVPDGLPPRAALGYLTVPLLYVLYRLHLIRFDVSGVLRDTIADLKRYRTLFSTQSKENPAYAYAHWLKSCMPIIYGEHGTTDCIAQRWRAQFAENSKMLAHTHMLPELDHNEIVGWRNNPDLLKRSVIIWLNDPSMHHRNRLRQKITQDVIADTPALQLTFEGSSDSWCQRLFYLVHLGDWISYWCALEHAANPTSIENIDTLKSRMKQA